ncbi:preprotein translocase subunit YajC [Roseibacillus ishigakijimensis]|uniref:Sec translocon accessory complex subunit YajC n=1 Tax=Roseibacillus ishigakijimensis TaxID=454146 RepID=A0A934RP06_9BACT|nr:preprotein translocase subunit YajC [Roseibacillus ishigakijimensis]MBK1832916.1 preprotein translocase subunit YajC [Roseibacillus ishigakijimensis]
MTFHFDSLSLLAQASSGGNPLASQLVPIILMVAIFYLLIFRPQQKQRKELQARIDSLEKGDKVITTGGLHGSVHSLSDKTVTLKVGGDNVFLTFDKTSVASVKKLKAEKAEEKNGKK